MQYGFRDAIAKVGLYKFLSDLFWIGMFYHLYNQVSDCYVYCIQPKTCMLFDTFTYKAFSLRTYVALLTTSGVKTAACY